MIRVKWFKLAEGLWWRRVGNPNELFFLELVGADQEKADKYMNAIRAIEKITGVPEHILREWLVKMRPDLNQESWLKVFLRAEVRKEDIEEES